MTQAEANEALARIERIARDGAASAPLAFGLEREKGWERASARLEEEFRAATEALRAFVRSEDKTVGTVLTDWTGDVYCVWRAGSNAGEQARHLERFQLEFARRVRIGYVVAAAVRAALELARLAAAPLTVAGAARAAWELVEELQHLRKGMAEANRT